MDMHSISVLLYCIWGGKSTWKMNKYRENVYLFLEELKMEEGEGGKLQFIGEFFLCTFLSVAKEKYQKNRHLRESPTVPPLRNPPPDLRDSFAHRGAKESDCAHRGAKESDCAQGRQDPITRTAVRVTAARLAVQLGGKVACFSERFASASCPLMRERRLPSRRQGVTRSPTARQNP